MRQSNEAGKKGEKIAADYLLKKGYRIVSKNFRSQRGEIDLIATTGNYLVFVEVKERVANALVSPLEAVTLVKRARVIRAAQYYLMRYPSQLQPRFDVIAIVHRLDGGYAVTHLENAFEGGAW